MKAMFRAAALWIPPIRRLYSHSVQLAQREKELMAELATKANREQHILSELARAADERDALDLQLYVMRSDLQRATARNQELSAALHASEVRLAQVERDLGRDAAIAHKMYERLSAQLDRLSLVVERLLDIKDA